MRRILQVVCVAILSPVLVIGGLAFLAMALLASIPSLAFDRKFIWE